MEIPFYSEWVVEIKKSLWIPHPLQCRQAFQLSLPVYIGYGFIAMSVACIDLQSVQTAGIRNLGPRTLGELIDGGFEVGVGVGVVVESGALSSDILYHLSILYLLL